MAERSRIDSTDWAVATRVGPTYEAVKNFGKLPPRNPRLLVPVDLQAFVVRAGTNAGGNRGDVRSRMLDEVPTERLPPPFSAADDLAPGIHLHWAVPDGLTKARPAPPGGTERDLNLRPLPNRWLVTRLGPARPGATRPTRSWIVESERGRSMELATWDPADAGDGTRTLTPTQFTAAAGGDLGWAGIYDNVRDRLAFHDDLADLGSTRSLLTYVVVGWYSDAALDPLHPPTDPSSFSALLDDLGWDADLSSLPEVEDRYTAVDLHLESLAKQVGMFETDRPNVIRPNRRVGPADRVVDKTALGIEDLVLSDKVDLAIVFREPRVTSSLYHGTIYGVDPRGAGVDQRPTAAAVGLTLGTTGVDVMSRTLAGTDAVQERMLDAFSYGTLRDFRTDDGIVAHDEAVHRHGFATLPDPTPGIVERVRDPAITVPTPPSFGGTKFDGLLDIGVIKEASMQIVFADDWQSAHELTLESLELANDLSFAKPPLPGGPGLGGGPEIGPIGGIDPRRPQGRTASAPSADPAPTYTDIVRPNPRWYQPTDPVIAVRGANRSQRHGFDGRFDPGERLGCRLSGQPIRAYADLLHGRVVVAPLGHGGLPAECDELVREASLSDPNAIAQLVSLVPSSLGWTEAQVVNRLDAEMVLSVHLAAREADVGELLDASLKEGVEQSPVGITYWQQPWVPIYAEWEATLATTDRTVGWELGEIDLDPRATLPTLGTRVLNGRGLLNSSSSRNLASAVDRFLDAEAIADDAGSGILSDADAEDLAELALAAARADVLIATLDGINDHFLGFDSDVTFADPDDDDPVVSPTRLPELLRGGWLRLDRLRLVDAFGRTLDLAGRLNGLALTDALETTATPAELTAPSAAPAAHLAPRLTTPSRLRMRFIDANDDTAEARIDESTPIQALNPVAGWLLPDHADDALEFFDAAGLPLGQLFHRGLRSSVTWEGAPGRPGPLGAGPAGDLAGSEHLARMAVAIVQRDATERAAGLSVDESPLGALLRAVDTTLWSTDPVGSAGTAPISVLVGRPIAVVRLRMAVEMYDDTDDYALSTQDAASRRAAYAAMVDRGITARLGALSRFDDGVLGYFVEDDYSIFHPIHAAVRELARYGGPQQGFLDDVDAAAAYGRDLDPRPIIAPFVQGEPDLVLRPGRDVTLSVLILAGLGINATCGIVPRKRLELSRSWTDAALQRIVPSFRIGPVLVDPSEIRMPRVSALPETTDGSLKNTWTRRDTPTTWRDDPILAASMAARLTDRPAVGHEGWARLVAGEDS